MIRSHDQCNFAVWLSLTLVYGMRVKRFPGNMYFKQLYYLNSLSVAVHMMHAILYFRSFNEYGWVTDLILLSKRALTCWLWGYVMYIYLYTKLHILMVGDLG